jgi:hypothetical protein
MFTLKEKPFFKLLKKNVEFNWSNEADIYFKALKEKLIQAPILVPPNFDKTFIIKTDDSHNRIEGVIMQKNENKRRNQYIF